MSKYTKLLWLLSPSQRVTFTKIKSTYSEIISRCLKIKDPINMDNEIFIPLFSAPQTVAKSDITKVKNLKFELHVKILKTELTLAYENGTYRLCKTNKRDADLCWELPTETLKKKEKEAQKELNVKKEGERIKSETDAEELKTILQEQGEKVVNKINKVINSECGVEELKEMLEETQNMMINRFDKLVKPVTIKKEEPCEGLDNWRS